MMTLGERAQNQRMEQHVATEIEPIYIELLELKTEISKLRQEITTLKMQGYTQIG